MRRPVNPILPIILVRGVQASLLAFLLHGALHWPLTGPRGFGLFLTPLLCAYFVFVFVGPWAWGLPILVRLPNRNPVIALTFDDGPSRASTPRVLDILKAHQVQATFFVLGEAVEANPDLLRRIVAEGHSVGIHAYRHRALVLASPAALRQELRQAAAAIAAADPRAGTVRWFRPPYGFKSMVMPFVVRRLGLRVVTWTVNPRDYRPQAADELVRMVEGALRPGTILLLHDGPDSRIAVEALPLLLQRLRARGYRGVTL